MKKRLKFVRWLLPTLLFFLSCSKNHDDGTAADCITAAIPTTAPVSALTSNQLEAIDSLFRHNQLSTSGLQFFWVDSNYYLPPGYNNEVQQIAVTAYLWFNNLPVFMYDDNFIFYNGALQSNSVIYHGTTPGPDTSFHRTLASLRSIYLNNFEKVAVRGGAAADTGINHPSPTYSDSCLLAQPGYIDPWYFHYTLTPGASLVKGWKVTPLGGWFPMVFIADSTGAAWPAPASIP